MANLKPVPNDDGRINERATTTSFRIPIPLFKKVKAEAERLNVSLSHVYMRALTSYFGMFESESWETTGNQDVYDPSRFYTRSQDNHGHSSTLHTPIPKPLAAEITALAQSGAVPAYRSAQDVVRDAVYHRVKQVAVMVDNGDLEVAVNMAMLLSDEVLMIDERENAEALIAALRTNAQSIYSSEGAGASLKRYLAQRRELADSVPERFRNDYLSAIEDYEKRIEKDKGKRKPRRKS